MTLLPFRAGTAPVRRGNRHGRIDADAGWCEASVRYGSSSQYLGRPVRCRQTPVTSDTDTCKYRVECADARTPAWVDHSGSSAVARAWVHKGDTRPKEQFCPPVRRSAQRGRSATPYRPRPAGEISAPNTRALPSVRWPRRRSASRSEVRCALLQPRQPRSRPPLPALPNRRVASHRVAGAYGPACGRPRLDRCGWARRVAASGPCVSDGRVASGSRSAAGLKLRGSLQVPLRAVLRVTVRFAVAHRFRSPELRRGVGCGHRARPIRCSWWGCRRRRRNGAG